MYIIKIEINYFQESPLDKKTNKKGKQYANITFFNFFILQCILRNKKSIKSWFFCLKSCMSMLMILPEFESGKDR